MHAVSVGEVQAAAPVVRAARAHGYGGSLILSTVTATGAENARRLIGELYSEHFYAPWDIPFIARRASDALRPDVYAAVETEVWPVLLTRLRAGGASTMLINARVSDRAMAKGRAARAWMRAAYSLFDEILPRSEEDARRLVEIGVADDVIGEPGDAKIDAALERRAASEDEARDAARIMRAGSRPCLVAASTHDGEERASLDAYSAIGGAGSGAALVIVPRHPERAAQAAELAREHGRVALWSSLSSGEDRGEPDIIVVDVIGVLFAIYASAAAVFIGGSIAPRGGQNILEPAAWGVPICHGPHMEDFSAPTRELDACGAAVEVDGADGIAAHWRASLASARAPRGLPSYFEHNVGAAARIWGRIAARARDDGRRVR